MSTMAVLDGTAAVEWDLWTTRARLVLTDASVLDEAQALVRRRLAEVDVAASRFRPDSEVRRIAESSEQVHELSPLLTDLVRAALDAAEQTNGAEDPTLGSVMTHLGYGTGGPGSTASVDQAPAPRWTARRRVTWCDAALADATLRLPVGTMLDLGATAKAVAADRGAREVAETFGCGALLSLGGDLSVAGPEPVDGWNVLVQDGDDEPASTIRLSGAAAVATSSTLHRRWLRNGQQMHHVIDPVTLLPASPVWRTVSVAADSCLRANTLATQAIVLGSAALSVLADAGVPCRLVGTLGDVTVLGGWPV